MLGQVTQNRYDSVTPMKTEFGKRFLFTEHSVSRCSKQALSTTFRLFSFCRGKSFALALSKWWQLPVSTAKAHGCLPFVIVSLLRLSAWEANSQGATFVLRLKRPHSFEQLLEHNTTQVSLTTAYLFSSNINMCHGGGLFTLLNCTQHNRFDLCADDIITLLFHPQVNWPDACTKVLRLLARTKDTISNLGHSGLSHLL